MKRRLVSVVILCCAAGMIIALSDTASAQSRGAAGSVDVENIAPQLVDGPRPHVYAVKMLCGTIPPITNFKQFPAPNADELLVPGTYLSMINILNPGREAEAVEILAVRPSGVGLGSVSAMGENVEIQFDCVNFLAAFPSGPAPTPPAALTYLGTNFVKGFYLVKSSEPLVVVGVNTFKNVERK